MKKLLALVLFTACGSGSNATTEPDAAGSNTEVDAGTGKDTSWYTSGTRIKMRTLNTPDGARQYVGWHDTSYDVDCTFRLATDDATRCLPNDVAYHVNLYSDSGCTIPAVLAYNCNAAPKYIEMQTLTAACGGQGSTSYFGAVYTRGAQLSTVYQNNGSCAAITIGPEFTAYGIGAEIQLSSWQSATVSVDP